jgi:tRNA-uridine 2-sulfurtransferase
MLKKRNLRKIMEKIVVGLSGGVDSSVAAALLCDQGYEVIGLTLWLMKGKGQCCSEGMTDAAKICEQLGIEHHIVDNRETFEKYIVDYLVTGYQAGITPLPCSQCNSEVKFGPMVAYAKETWDSDFIATGHYARIDSPAETLSERVGDRYRLRRAVDLTKDQSYFLYTLTQPMLASTVFPLGEMRKTETREIASKLGLSTAQKPESMDLCLVEKHGSMQSFLEQYLAPAPGEIINCQGQVLGEHQGIHNYTIGQRRGIGLAAPEPLYVVSLNPGKNQVIVGSRAETHSSECTVDRINWVSIAAPTAPIRASVQVRYRSPAAWATVIPIEDSVRIIFDEPQFGITPGQAAVWYDGDVVLGGGILTGANS